MDFGNEEGIFWRETVVASLALYLLENVVFEADDASDVAFKIGFFHRFSAFFCRPAVSKGADGEGGWPAGVRRGTRWEGVSRMIIARSA